MRGTLIERAWVDPDGAPPAVSAITHLTDAADPQWAGIVGLGPSQTYALDAGWRYDVQILRGDVDADRHPLLTGDFLSLCDPATLRAGPAGARLFVYREAAARRCEPVVHAARQRVWFDGRHPRMRVVPLSDNGHRVSLVAWQPGARTVDHAHPQGEELFVLSGELLGADEPYPAGTWVRLHPGARHRPFAQVPTVILLRHGHLRAAAG